MSKCENCKKYDDCRDGSGLTWPCGAYRPIIGELLPEEVQELAQTKTEKESAEYVVEAIGSEAKHIIDLLRAEAEGRLVVLPLPIGSTAFDISQGFIEPMEKIHVTFAYGQRGIIYHMPMGIFLDGLNKGLIKSTREEAEKALEVRE